MRGPSLAATSAVTIQGATVNKDGSFAPASPDTLPEAPVLSLLYWPPSRRQEKI
jgi:hypothetical protein